MATLLLERFVTRDVPRALTAQAVRFLTKLVKTGLHLCDDTKRDIVSKLRELLLTDMELFSLVITCEESSPQMDPSNTSASYDLVTFDWLIASARNLSKSDGSMVPSAPNLIRLLLILDGESVMSLFTSPQFNDIILERCMHFVVEMTRSQPPERVGQFYWVSMCVPICTNMYVRISGLFRGSSPLPC